MKFRLLTGTLALLAFAAATHEAAAQRRSPAPAGGVGATAPDNTPTPPADPSGKLDYRNPAADPLVPVEADKRRAITDDLQATVAELLELFHDSKQCHWNLRGPLYLPLHEKLQENADEYRKYADILAERVLQVGSPIDGRPGVVAATSNLGELPGGYLTDKQVLILMTERITTVAKRVRQRIDHLSKVDEVTSNKLQDLSYQLDKHVWQFRVHMQ
ncbi:DNA starvation/stationary phase protection protein [Hymenobacter caeli]|uniref:Starvation-inducible DNA-binding protein n=1 Tax=Hymenobacter caeli TaxID=2735894 RepID=A0ABX2FYI8_9BACT|nr:DNA starvation/stationary phase protection protein [Hymenobacter caeli]NRT21474.1 starvation-inducible DNA-binding protein [Hymenobacter caeli]